jgi:3-(3-hydroxy-phenyl)propionate hydroxylase
MPAKADNSVAPDWDVAVIGCGPVGAFAANLLGRAGLRTIVLEQASKPYPLPRAVHIDHEIMRLLQSVGLTERIEPTMVAGEGNLHIGADGGVIRYMGSAGEARPYGWASDYFFHQPDLEAELRRGLSRFAHVTLRLGERVVEVTQDDTGVSLRSEHYAQGSETIRAHYLIACDGARSETRKALGIPLDDLDFEEPWLVVDAEVDEPIRFPDFPGLAEDADLQRLSVMMCDPSRPCTVVPGPGAHRRWEFMLLPGEDDEAMTARSVVMKLMAPWLEGVKHRVTRAATYRFHGLIADRWRAGRVFLAGDAAHQTPPFFGQGMCHGMRDVANLAWKLERVLAGQSPESLLDTYQAERDAQVRAVVGEAVAAGRYICELDPAAAAARDAELRRIMAANQAQPRRHLVPSYCGGVISPSSGGERFIQPRAATPDGEATLLDEVTGGGWVQIATAELSSAAKAAVSTAGLKTFVLGQDLLDSEGSLADWLRERDGQAVIVRPDFYVFGVAGNPDDLLRLLEDLAHVLGDQGPAEPAKLQGELIACC